MDREHFRSTSGRSGERWQPVTNRAFNVVPSGASERFSSYLHEPRDLVSRSTCLALIDSRDQTYPAGLIEIVLVVHPDSPVLVQDGVEFQIVVSRLSSFTRIGGVQTSTDMSGQRRTTLSGLVPVAAVHHPVCGSS